MTLKKKLALGGSALIGGLVILAAAGTLWIRSELLQSLPILDGERAVAGLDAPVEIERDALGIPTIRAANRLDVARATGFLHAQDRFFQMDLLRRRAAGELAELFGPAGLEADRSARLHRLRTMASRRLDTLPVDQRTLLNAYAAGARAGLAALDSPPPEYLLLRTEPAPWRDEDSILVLLAMYLDLQDERGRRDSALGLMRDLLPEELVGFLAPVGTEWDAPLLGDAIPTPPAPGADVFDLRTEVASRSPSGRIPDETGPDLFRGSNNWAVAGAHTADGGALLVNDMHLGLSLPNIWYRARFSWTDDQGEPHEVTGATLPGAPAMIVGSNGSVAWGFTNSQIDNTDLVLVETSDDDPDVYRTAEGPRRLDRHQETLAVKGGEDETFEIVSTIWGPIVDRDHLDRPRAVRWVAHEPEAVNMALADLETARTLEEAFAVARRCGIPAQNFVVATSRGRIGWTLIGRIPRRVGLDGSVPTSWADGARGWSGWLTADEIPVVVDPERGRVWTANHRTVDGEHLARVGQSTYALGARARQIRDGLLALDDATPADMLAIQLDDRAILLERWRDLLLSTLTDEVVQADERRREMRRFVRNDWSGRAAVDSVGYRLVRAFRLFLTEQVFEPLIARCKEADEEFAFSRLGQVEGPLWRLVTDRPHNLLDPRFRDWDEQLVAAVDATLDYFLTDDPRGLSERTWGERNTVRLRHPISRGVAQLSPWLDTEAHALPGDALMPRVQSPGFGASQRMAVSPGREEHGYFHMPGGQSGHPLSPFYRSGHEAWVAGEPTPFLPGASQHRLTLIPGED